MILAYSLAFAGPVDLDGARVRATEHALAVALADADLHRARGDVWLAASDALPAVDLFASASVGAGLTSFGFERPVRSQASAGVTGRWTLLAPGAWAAADAARRTARGSAALFEWARVTARRDATLAVADLLAADAELAAWTESAADARKAADGMESLVASGLRPPADAARAEATAASLEARVVAARGTVAGRCAELQALLREPVDGRCALEVPDAPVPSEANGEHPALEAAAEALAAARAARTGVLLGRVPAVSATGTAGHYIAGGSEGFGWSAGVEARLPVLSGGAGAGATAVATSARDRAELELEAQTLALASARVAAEARWEAATTGLTALEVADRAAGEALALTEGRYREGLEDLEGWLLARRDRDDARVALARGRAERLAALAELEAVRGVR